MPTRYLKPGICDSSHIEAIKSPEAEVLYYRLLVTVDDYGRLDARPLVVKSKCFPIKESVLVSKIIEWLCELQDADMILLYEVNESPFLQVKRWDNKPRAKESKCPEIPQDTYKRMQMYAGVKQLHTVLPVTVTVTGTETRAA